MKFKLCAYLVLLYLTVLPVLAQDFNVRIDHIDTKDGLIHRDVYSVFEDNKGFLWIGTQKGLQRYDGHEFKTWNKASKSGLLYAITKILQDDEGWLWLWNNKKLKFVFLNPETEEILTEKERFPNMPISLETDNAFIWTRIAKRDNKQKLCFSTDKGKIITYCGNTGFDTINIKNFELPTQLSFIDSKDNFWLHGMPSLDPLNNDYSTLYKIDSKGGLIKKIKLENGSVVGQFCEFEDKICFVSLKTVGDSALTKFGWIDRNDSLILDDDFIDPPNGLYEVESKLWFWTKKKGYSVYESITKQPLFTLNENDHESPFATGTINLIEDSRGIIWISNHFGLYKLEINKNKFTNYLNFETDDKPFNNSARGITLDNDQIFVNLEMAGTYAISKSDPNQYHKIGNKPWCRPILSTSNSNLIIGYSDILTLTNKKGDIQKKYLPDDPIHDNFNGIWTFYFDKNDKLWIGGEAKLLYKNKSNDKVNVFKSEGDPFGFAERQSTVNNIVPFKNDLVWFCSDAGLYLFNTETEEFLARYASDEEDYFLPADVFHYIYEDEDGLCWIGTSDGLIRWEGPESKSKNPFQLFTRAQGLSNDVIYAIFEDEYNRLWMSSDYGLMSFDKESYDIQVYLEDDGISHHEFNRTSHYMDEDGRIYFGGLNGITSFHPDDFQTEEKYQSEVIISDYEILDGATEKLTNKVGELRKSKEIYFRPGDRYFRLKFTIPTFKDSSKKLYGWKIEGVDADWNYQKENSIQIGVLPYGIHKLRIKGQSGHGGWSPKELQIDVHVLKPFYLQAWFLILSLLSMILGIVLFFKIRTRVLKKEIKKATIKITEQAEELRKLDLLKSRFFANVSHELRTPLSMMLGPISNLIKENGHSVKAQKLLSFLQRNTLHLKGLVNEILDLSKLESNKMELHEEPTEFYSYLRNHLAQFYSFGSSESIAFKAEFPEDKEMIILLDRKKFEKIINNYLSNAMKFTPVGGRVVLKTQDLGNDLLLSVVDTGRGIHPDDVGHVFDRFYQSSREDAPTEGGTGIGLSLCKELAELMGGSVWVESDFGKGSTFHVKIKKTTTQLSPTLPMGILDIALETDLATVTKKEDSLPQINKDIHILIAEDNKDLREYYQMILSDYKVYTTEHGQAALDYLQSGTELPDLIISDLMMPVMDGMQLIQNLKESDQWRHIPVIMLTAKSDRNVRIKALRVGIDDYVTKPFDDEELLVRIQNLFNRSQERKIESVAENEVGDDTQGNLQLIISQEEMEWLEAVEIFIVKNLDNDLLSVDLLCKEFLVSRSTFQRQIKKTTGLSSLKYINEHRLNYARELLENKRYRTVSQVANKSGFSDLSSFSRSFKKRFGITPKVAMAD